MDSRETTVIDLPESIQPLNLTWLKQSNISRVRCAWVCSHKPDDIANLYSAGAGSGCRIDVTQIGWIFVVLKGLRLLGCVSDNYGSWVWRYKWFICVIQSSIPDALQVSYKPSASNNIYMFWRICWNRPALPQHVLCMYRRSHMTKWNVGRYVSVNLMLFYCYILPAVKLEHKDSDKSNVWNVTIFSLRAARPLTRKTLIFYHYLFTICEIITKERGITFIFWRQLLQSNCIYHWEVIRLNKLSSHFSRVHWALFSTVCWIFQLVSTSWTICKYDLKMQI